MNTKNDQHKKTEESKTTQRGTEVNTDAGKESGGTEGQPSTNPNERTTVTKRGAEG